MRSIFEQKGGLLFESLLLPACLVLCCSMYDVCLSAVSVVLKVYEREGC